MNKFKLSLLAIIAMTFAFVSCKEDKIVTPTVVQNSKVMVVHASPNAPNVDLLIDDVKKNTVALAYPTNTGYLTVLAGVRNFKVNVAGTSGNVINASPTLIKDLNYSIFAVDSASKISALVTVDDLTTPAPGKAHVRFIHLSPNAPTVDVSLATDSAGVGLFLNRTFNKTITPAQEAFTSVSAGIYNLEVRVSPSTIVAVNLPAVNLQAGKIYTIFAKGFFGGSGAQALGAEIIVNK